MHCFRKYSFMGKPVPPDKIHARRRLMRSVVIAIVATSLTSSLLGGPGIHPGRAKRWRWCPTWSWRDPYKRPYRAAYRRATGIDIDKILDYHGSQKNEASKKFKAEYMKNLREKMTPRSTPYGKASAEPTSTKANPAGRQSGQKG